ncbi:MAG: hypothetical protein ACLP1X_20805 [Polyangiaceae bacterium]
MRASRGWLLAAMLLGACGGSGGTSTSHGGSDASLDGTTSRSDGGSTSDATLGADGSMDMDSATGTDAPAIMDGSGTGTDAGMGTDAGPGPDGATDGGPDAAPCEATFVEAGASAGDAEVPLYHRTTACCPSQRGPGGPNQPYPPGFASPLADDAGGCTSDSDCTAGANGRCFPFEGEVGLGGCSYDECFTDSNCGSGTPCVCRSSSTDNSANVCDPGGNCAIDSDCGPGGYCSPSWESCYEGPPYYCHTALDTCINDADCSSLDAGECSLPSATCAYDLQEQRWACSPLCCLPP